MSSDAVIAGLKLKQAEFAAEHSQLLRRFTAGKGLKLDDPAVRRGFENRVSATLNGLKTRGILVNGSLDADGRSTHAPAP